MTLQRSPGRASSQRAIGASGRAAHLVHPVNHSQGRASSPQCAPGVPRWVQIAKQRLIRSSYRSARAYIGAPLLERTKQRHGAWRSSSFPRPDGKSPTTRSLPFRRQVSWGLSITARRSILETVGMVRHGRAPLRAQPLVSGAVSKSSCDCLSDQPHGWSPDQSRRRSYHPSQYPWSYDQGVRPQEERDRRTACFPRLTPRTMPEWGLKGSCYTG
jgi:hypothetical protein